MLCVLYSRCATYRSTQLVLRTRRTAVGCRGEVVEGTVESVFRTRTRHLNRVQSQRGVGVARETLSEGWPPICPPRSM